MATLQDLTVSAVLSILSTLALLVAFAFLRIHPINDRVYHSKLYLKGTRKSSTRSGNLLKKLVKSMNWMPEALRMSESELINHASVDSAAYLRIYLLGLKMFVPMAFLAILVLVPVHASGTTLSCLGRDIDKLSISNVSPGSQRLSISNVSPGSQRFWSHIVMAYIFTLWTFHLLYKEYDTTASMRLQFLASQSRRADQFTVLVRNIPPGSGRSISEKVEHFFQTNHRNHYLCHQQVYDGNKFVEHVAERKSLRNCLDYYQLKFERHPEARTTCRTGFLGLFGRRVDSIDFYKQKIEDLETKMIMEHQKVLKDPQAIMPVAFVSFSSRWHAAVCAQTQQSKNPTLWLTEWAPEPRDVYWQNLVIPLASLGIRRLVMAVSVFALVLFYMIPIVLVQSLANLDGLERAAPFLRAVIELKVIKSFLQGFLPGLMLKIFLFFLPTILTIMSKVEGHVSVSKIEREAAAKHYYFMLVNVFLGSIIAGTGFQQLYSFLHQSPIEIPKTIWVSFPMKATFFMTYTMVDGWASIAGETLRLKSLAIFHIKNMFLVKTEKDREQAMDPGTIGITENLPKLQLYFLLGLVYAVVSPVLLPFIIIFFGLAFLVHRHQIINVHDPLYDSVAAFWPHVHGTIIASLMISHFLLLGLLSAKKAASSTPLITILPVLTFGFHKYCKKRFEPAFLKYSLEEAMAADTLVGAVEPDLNLRESLVNAYLHPIVRAVEDLDKGDVRGERAESPASTPISMLSAPSPAFDKGSLYAAGYV